jgi:hypothetical protein
MRQTWYSRINYLEIYTRYLEDRDRDTRCISGLPLWIDPASCSAFGGACNMRLVSERSQLAQFIGRLVACSISVALAAATSVPSPSETVLISTGAAAVIVPAVTAAPHAVVVPEEHELKARQSYVAGQAVAGFRLEPDGDCMYLPWPTHKACQG